MVDKNSFLIRLCATVIILAVFVFMFLRDLEAENRKKLSASYTCPTANQIEGLFTKDYTNWVEKNCPDSARVESCGYVDAADYCPEGKKCQLVKELDSKTYGFKCI